MMKNVQDMTEVRMKRAWVWAAAVVAMDSVDLILLVVVEDNSIHFISKEASLAGILVVFIFKVLSAVDLFSFLEHRIKLKSSSILFFH